MIETFDLGDIVEMKKQHPCGSKEFEVIRLGADIKIRHPTSLASTSFFSYSGRETRVLIRQSRPTYIVRNRNERYDSSTYARPSRLQASSRDPSKPL